MTEEPRAPLEEGYSENCACRIMAVQLQSILTAQSLESEAMVVLDDVFEHLQSCPDCCAALVVEMCEHPQLRKLIGMAGTA